MNSATPPATQAPDTHTDTPGEHSHVSHTLTAGPERPERPDHPQGDVRPERSERPWWAQASTQPHLTRRNIRYRTWQGVLTKVALVMLVVSGTWWVLDSSEVRDVEPVAGNGLAYRQTNNALIGGCGPIYTFSDAESRSGIVSEYTTNGAANRQNYDTIVPMYGPFWDAPLTQKKTFWARTDKNLPLPENLLANQWQGDLVVYYSASATADEVETLRQVATGYYDTDEQMQNLRLRVVPWVEERGRLPEGRKFAFVTWNHSQTCHQFIAPALGDFREFAPFTQAPGADGTKAPAYRFDKYAGG